MRRHDLRLEAAKLASDTQRQRLRDRLDATRARLLPSRLTFDATQAIEQRISDGAKVGVDHVKAHPVLAGLGVGALVAWLFREPLIDQGPDKLRSLWGWLAGKAGLSEADLAEADCSDKDDDRDDAQMAAHDAANEDPVDDAEAEPNVPPPPPPGVQNN